MTLIKKTTVREYNAQGKVIKKTVTEEHRAPAAPQMLPAPWQTPLVSYGKDTYAVPCDTTITVNGDLTPGYVTDAVIAAIKS